MESVSANFSKVEAVLTKIHSYDTFVLQMVPVMQISDKAAIWWDETVQ